jgi:hypothetical protein
MTYTRKLPNTSPLPVDPGVLCVHVPNSASETNMPIYVPWKRCQLSHAYSVVSEAIDTAGAMEIDLELNAAGGTEMMSISVAANSSVGDIDEATVSSASACKGLSYDDSSYDAVNVEVDGGGGTGSVNLFLYFESDRN